MGDKCVLLCHRKGENIMEVLGITQYLCNNHKSLYRKGNKNYLQPPLLYMLCIAIL